MKAREKSPHAGTERRWKLVTKRLRPIGRHSPTLILNSCSGILSYANHSYWSIPVRINVRSTGGVMMVLMIQLLSVCWAVADDPIDPAERFIREAQNRAEYWKARGYSFDPFLMSADSMDRHVQNQQRAAYWAERGFKFDPDKLSAYAMDRTAEAVLRAEYWKRWGIEFDAQVMDAETMDDAAVKLQRAQVAIQELKEKFGDAPAMVFDEAAAKIMSTPPKVKGGQQTNRPAQTAAVPPAIAPPIMAGGAGIGIGGMGMGMGGGNRGNVGNAANGAIAVPRTNNRGTVRTGGSLQIPPGVDLEDFLRYLQRQGY